MAVSPLNRAVLIQFLGFVLLMGTWEPVARKVLGSGLEI